MYIVLFLFQLIISSCGSDVVDENLSYSPSFKDAQIETESFILNSNQNSEQVIQTKSGSKYTIPTDCFVDENGEKIKGDVDLYITEYHDYADVIAGGMPMFYDENGDSAVLATAGMVNVRGFQNGEEIYIAPQQEINIELHNPIIADDIELFSYNDDESEWSKIQGLKRKIIDANGDEIDTSFFRVGIEQPVKPAQYVEGEMVFELDFSKLLVSNSLKSHLWKIINDDQETIEILKRNIEKNNYSLRSVKVIDENTQTIKAILLVNEGNQLKTLTTKMAPILQGKALEHAMKNYELNKAKTDSTLAYIKNEKLKSAKVVNTFQMNMFGLINCDFIYKLENLAKHEVIFKYNDKPLDKDCWVHCIYKLDNNLTPTLKSAYFKNTSFTLNQASSVKIEYLLQLSETEVVYLSDDLVKNAFKNKQNSIEISDKISRVESLDVLRKILM